MLFLFFSYHYYYYYSSSFWLSFRIHLVFVCLFSFHVDCPLFLLSFIFIWLVVSGVIMMLYFIYSMLLLHR